MRTRVIEALGLHHRPVAGLLGMLVTVALGLNLLFLTHKFLGVPDHDGFGFEQERGIPAVVGFVFTAWAAGLAAYLAVVHRQAVLAGWSALFAVLLADDFFMLHERMATVISADLGIAQPYGPPIGEIVWLGSVGATLLAAIAMGHRFAVPEWRTASRVLLALLGLLVMHSPTDSTVDISNAGEIFREARHPRSFVSLEGADHLLTAPGQAKRAARIISAWADQYLTA